MGARKVLPALALLVLVAAACGDGSDAADEPDEITVYSGRSEELVGPLLEQFEQASGILVNVRYGDTAEMAAQILEEGDRSPADVFYGQDAGALGALQAEGVLASLPQDLLEQVPAAFRSSDGLWVGTSGRARVLVFNPALLDEAAVPDTIDALTEAAWRGKVGWAPTNGSFQASVTALRELRGEDGAETWLRAMIDNDTKMYPNNDSIVEAVSTEEITLGLVNHYYAFEALEENPDASVADHFMAPGDPGSLINVAGAAVLRSSSKLEAATRFVEYLLSADGQRYFVEETFEYPMIQGLAPSAEVPSLSSLEPPDLDLSQLADLQGTLALLGKVGLL